MRFKKTNTLKAVSIVAGTQCDWIVGTTASWPATISFQLHVCAITPPLPQQLLKHLQAYHTCNPYTCMCDIHRYMYIHRCLSLSSRLFIDNTRIWTQGLALAKQVLYHLSHTPSTQNFFFFLNSDSSRDWFIWILSFSEVTWKLIGCPQILNSTNKDSPQVIIGLCTNNSSRVKNTVP
jgi:hypothetical protein